MNKRSSDFAQANLRCGRCPENRLQQYVHFPGLSKSDAEAFESRLLDEWNDMKHRLMAEFEPLERLGVPHPPAPGVGIYYYVTGEEQNATRNYGGQPQETQVQPDVTIGSM